MIRDSHRQKVRSYVDLGEEEGAEVVLDGREPPREEGFFFGPTILDNVTGRCGWPRGDLRSGALCCPGRLPGRGHRVHEHLSLRQRLLDLHRETGLRSGTGERT